MPGPAAHLSIMELQRKRTAANPGLFNTVGSVLSSHPKESNLGSIGPDMVFWADWGGATLVVNAVFDVYDKLDKVYDQLAALWKPIGDAIDKVETSLTGSLSNSINETVSECNGILNTAMLDLITSKVNYFDIQLHPEFQKHAPLGVYAPLGEDQWNWLDYLHHRWTGQFNKALIRRAQDSGDPAQQAYAYGWLSHVTADVVGHAYVNMAVGGPWRAHCQRHHLQENFMDVWTWGFYRTPGVTLLPPGGSYDYDRFTDLGSADLQNLIDLGDDLPDSLQGLIAGTLDDVYRQPVQPDWPGGRPHPVKAPFPDKSAINRAYQEQKRAFEIMTGKDRRLGAPRPPKVLGDMEPPTFPAAPGSGGGSGSGGSSSGFSFLAVLAAIAKFITETLIYIGELTLWLVGMVNSALTYPVRLALYLVQLGLYEVFRAFRWALVITGYVYPDADQLAHPFAEQFLNPHPSKMTSSPRLEFPPQQDHCGEYPTSGLELPNVLVAPYGHFGNNYPYWFIEGEPTDAGSATSASVESQLSSPILTVGDTTGIALKLADNSVPGKPYSGSLGSAVDFFLRRAHELHKNDGNPLPMSLPDWNLDADRGYGFRCWQAKTPLQTPPSDGIVVEYL